MEITAAVINYNSGRDLDVLLPSLLSQTIPLRIIVIDNASSDDSWKRAEKFDGVEIIRNQENTGFAAAANIAIERSSTPFVAILNPDTYFERDFFEKVLRLFNEDEKIGMVSGKILRFDRSTLDSTGQMRSLADRPVERGYGEKDRGQYKSGEVFSVCGAAGVYRRQMLEDIKDEHGYFDSRYFMFFEDFDLGWRARRRGWKAYYLSDAICYHRRGGGKRSARFPFLKMNSLLKYHVIKNYWLTIIKNETLWGFLIRFPFIFLRTFLYLVISAFSSPSTLVMLARNLKFFFSEFKKRIC